MAAPTVELFYGNGWHDVTGDFRRDDATAGGGITIQRGASAEASGAEPARCSLTVNNGTSRVAPSVSGRYSPRNPLSDLYGLIGRNTPLRVSTGTVHLGAADGDADTASTSHVAPSVTATTAGLLVCGWLAAGVGNYTVPGSMSAGPTETDGGFSTMRTAVETVTAGATGTRTATFSVSQEWAAFSVVLHGASVSVEESLSSDSATDDVTLTTDASTEAGWWLLAVQGWDWDRQDDMPDTPGQAGGWIPLADTGRLIVASDSVLHIKAWARRVTTAGAQTVVFPTSTSSLQPDNHAAIYVLSGVDDWWVRAAVEVAAWPPRRDVSDSDRWVPIEAAGILRRLGTGQRALRSPLRRAVPNSGIDSSDSVLDPVAYWPLEDDEGSTVAASGLPGGAPMRTSGGTVEFGQSELVPGSSPLPDLLTSVGRLVGRVAGSGDDSQVGFVVAFEATNAWTAVTVAFSAGPYVTVDIEFSSSITVSGTDDAGATTTILTAANDLSDGEPHWIELKLTPLGGGSVVHSLYVDGTQVDSQGESATTSAIISNVQVRPRASGTSATVGHVAVWATRSTGMAETIQPAMDGYADEAAGRRIQRLCREEGVWFEPIGDLDDTAVMGPQTIAPLLDLLRQAADVDAGILTEARQEVGVSYRCRTALYNAAAASTLDYAAGEVAPPLEPMPDDRLIVNRVVASRPGGSSATVEQVDGPAGTATVGVYEDPVTVHVSSDLHLPDQAGWRVHLGTVDEDRVPAVSVNLANPALSGDAVLSAQVLALAEGDRLDVTNPPSDLPPDDIRTLVQGYTEQVDQFVHTLTFTTSPASPYTVGVRDASIRGTDGAVTDSSFVAGTDTSLDVDVSGAGSLWTTSPPSGLKITVAGVDLEVTAIAAESGGVQTFTVVQTPVNGVEKTIPAGSEVRVQRDQQAVRGL